MDTKPPLIGPAVLGTLVLLLGACGGATPEPAVAVPDPLPPQAGVLPFTPCGDTNPWGSEGSAVPPEMLNLEEVTDSLSAEFGGPDQPALEAQVTLRVTRMGEVDRACLRASSGAPPFDSAAVSAAYRLEFVPASTDGEPRSVVVSVPLGVGGPPAGAGGMPSLTAPPTPPSRRRARPAAPPRRGRP